MFHHFFYEGLIGGSPPSTVGFRWGDYTVNGSYTRRINTGSTSLYLFDSDAKTALAASDFVIVMGVATTASADTPLLANSCNIRFDTQGDSGSGSLLSSASSTTTAKNVVWTTNSGNSGGGSDVNRDDDNGSVSMGFPLCLPASLFGTADSTRTGMVAATSAASTAILIEFIFCSWSSNTTSIYKPGNFTVNGCYVENFGGIQANYLFSSGLQTAASTSDFLIITWCTTSGNSTTVGYFDFQGDGGSGSMVLVGTGTGTAKNVVWKLTSHAPLYLPASLVGASDSTRTGCRLGNANAPIISIIPCNWGT